MLKSKLTAFAGALILAGTTFASQEVCPELSAIQTEGISMSMEIYGIYAAYNISNYNTDSSWGFIMAPFTTDAEEVVDTANEILSEMTAPGVLLQEGVCQYETGNPDLYALAVQDAFPTPAKLKQYIRR